MVRQSAGGGFPSEICHWRALVLNPKQKMSSFCEIPPLKERTLWPNQFSWRGLLGASCTHHPLPMGMKATRWTQMLLLTFFCLALFLFILPQCLWRCHTGPRGTGWASRASFISLSGLQSDYLLLCLLDTRSLRDGDAVYNFLTPVGLPFLQFHLNLFLLTVICIVFFFPLVSYAAHHRNTP